MNFQLQAHPTKAAIIILVFGLGLVLTRERPLAGISVSEADTTQPIHAAPQRAEDAETPRPAEPVRAGRLPLAPEPLKKQSLIGTLLDSLGFGNAIDDRPRRR